VGNRVARTVGRYEILEELGRGGMATVFLARQAELDRLVALKELSAFRQAEPSFTQRFLRESRLAGSLSHPNIVTVHDYFEHDGVPYIAMEYVERGSLRPHIGRVSLTQVAGILEGMLSALEYAERHQIVHRDLKPENVMVSSSGRVKITDFGIAKATGGARSGSFLTDTGTTVGTPNYMAPEQAMGRDIGPWTDLYSVGVMAFEFFVGRVPFSDTEEPMAILMRQVSDPIPPASSVNAEVDPEISAWIERLLVKDPEQRTRSAGEAWDDFEEIMLHLVGPRWRRSARLLEPSERAPDTPAGPHTTAPTRAAAPPLMATLAAPDGPTPSMGLTVMPESPTRRLEEETGPTRVEGRPRRGVPTVAKSVLLLFAVFFAAAAALGGHSSKPRSSNAATAITPTATVTGRDMALKMPPGWSRLRKAPDVGLPLSHATAAAPRGRDGVVAFGLVKGGTASNSTLLPAAFLASTGQASGGAPPRKAVRLPAHNLQAWRYGKLQPLGADRELTVYTVPTSAGVATVACAAPVGQGQAFAAQCDAIAATLELRGPTPYPVGPSNAYASSLNGTIGDLQQATTPAQQSFDSSKTLAGQATAAQSLASAYEVAAAQLGTLNLSPADRSANAELVRALQGAGRAYRKAARAATSGDAAAYRAASAAIPAAKARVNSALAGVRAAGYGPTRQGSASNGSSSSGGGSAKDGTAPASPAQTPSDVGDSRSDDPSDDSANP
jgi:serine/threonine protein kinase